MHKLEHPDVLNDVIDEDKRDVQVVAQVIGASDPKFKQTQTDANSRKPKVEAGHEFEKLAAPAASSVVSKIKNEELDDFDSLVFTGKLSPAPFKADSFGDASSDSKASLKTRMVLDCVYIKPSSSICAEDDTQRALAKLKAMQNPKLKLKKKKDEEMQLPLNPNTILPLLDAMENFPVTLPLAERSVTVSRDFMNHTFGGGVRKSFVKIRQEKVNEHGYNDFLYLTKEVDTLAPSIPGQPGLFFSTREAFDLEYTPVWMKEPYIFRVFTRLTSGYWLYQGQYKFAHCKTLTATEWCEQGEKVKNTWAQNIAAYGWGIDVRGRISFRDEFGRDPSAAELEELLLEQKKKMKTREAFSNITKEKILSEFNVGHEKMVIWKMECVGYDEEFQSRIAAEFKDWEVNHKSNGGNGHGKKPDVSRRKSETGARQRYEPDVPRQNKRSRGEIEVQYISRGTKSRPLVV
ncbi:hypothetical protein EV361DRAFT_865656 [Lentinula raphanica]|nr:hypothetical protein F5880DRAFT_1609895 [Lentinula raphanica]KAJ3975049.1 hypothetical protein EV361DRAFT_865656 [Lentinula raphanica]